MLDDGGRCAACFDGFDQCIEVRNGVEQAALWASNHENGEIELLRSLEFFVQAALGTRLFGDDSRDFPVLEEGDIEGGGEGADHGKGARDRDTCVSRRIKGRSVRHDSAEPIFFRGGFGEEGQIA